MYYRYWSPEHNHGIFLTLEEFLETKIKDKDEIVSAMLQFTAIFEDKLPLPNPMGICYFTEKGNRKFRKAITKIVKYLEENGIKIICDTFEDISDKTIVYTDRYQIALALKSEVKSND